MSDALPPLAVTMGDPAGCGPQIIAKAWHKLRAQEPYVFVGVGAHKAFDRYCPTQEIESVEDARHVFPNALPVIDVGTEMPDISPGEPSIAAAKAIIESIETATRLVQSGAASALVTNPINKALLYKAGFTHPGHTEFLASLCQEPTAPALLPVMMLVGGGLKVSLATIHLPLRDAVSALSVDRLMHIATVTHHALQNDFAISNPKIAFTGLNPHAGENGTIGTEEIETINPAAEKLRTQGINISDARPADTVFAEALSGTFDAVIAMTHDQGLIPVKTLDFWGGVNTTLGLPIIRTSPDHGSAYDVAKSELCREDSLLAAIYLARTNAQNRTRFGHLHNE